MAASKNSRTLVAKFFCEGFLKETLAKIHGAVSVNYLWAEPRHVEHAHRRANGCQLHCWVAASKTKGPSGGLSLRSAIEEKHSSHCQWEFAAAWIVLT